MGLATYLKETRGELKHVNWPSRRQAVSFTVIVIVISLAVAAVLSAFDLVFNTLLKLVI